MFLKTLSEFPHAVFTQSQNPAIVRNVIGPYITNTLLLSSIIQKIFTLGGKSSMKAHRSKTSVYYNYPSLIPVEVH